MEGNLDRLVLNYNSADAGLNVFDKLPEAKTKIQQACKSLNLVWQHQPCDDLLETPQIRWYRFLGTYWYGSSRWSRPETVRYRYKQTFSSYVACCKKVCTALLVTNWKSSLKRSGQLLAYHFRPQVLKKIPFPISSDALSGFGQDDRESHNKDVFEATKILIEQMIPACLEQLTKKEYEYRRLSIGAICKKIHDSGINLRFALILLG